MIRMFIDNGDDTPARENPYLGNVTLEQARAELRAETEYFCDVHGVYSVLRQTNCNTLFTRRGAVICRLWIDVPDPEP